MTHRLKLILISNLLDFCEVAADSFSILSLQTFYSVSFGISGDFAASSGSCKSDKYQNQFMSVGRFSCLISSNINFKSEVQKMARLYIYIKEK